MKSHDLAKFLLSQPNGHIEIQTVQGRKQCRVSYIEWHSPIPPLQDRLVVFHEQPVRLD